MKEIVNAIKDILVGLLLILIVLCLLDLQRGINEVAEDLEQFRQETYDRERDLLAAQVETAPVISIEKCEELHEKAGPDGAETHENAEWDHVLRVITAEGGSDQLVCNGVVQCLFNACQREGCSPEQVLRDYQYTGPADWISDEARNAWDAVFCSGYRFVDFEDALYFYAPAYCESEWHESQRFICEVGGVRFFEEAG